MKPTKNRYFCKDCRKTKMVFETEKKANTFIKFNSEEIEKETGSKPERSYFCMFCNGWHVTSQKKNLNIKSNTEKFIDLYDQEKEKKAQLTVERKLTRVKRQEELKESLDLLEQYIAILECSVKGTDDYVEKLDNAQNILVKAKNIKVTFKGSGTRRRDLEEKLNFLHGNESNKE